MVFSNERPGVRFVRHTHPVLSSHSTPVTPVFVPAIIITGPSSLSVGQLAFYPCHDVVGVCQKKNLKGF